MDQVFQPLHINITWGFIQKVDKKVLDPNENDKNGAKGEADWSDAFYFLVFLFELEIVENGKFIDLIIVVEREKNESKGGWGYSQMYL